MKRIDDDHIKYFASAIKTNKVNKNLNNKLSNLYHYYLSRQSLKSIFERMKLTLVEHNIWLMHYNTIRSIGILELSFNIFTQQFIDSSSVGSFYQWIWRERSIAYHRFITKIDGIWNFSHLFLKEFFAFSSRHWVHCIFKEMISQRLEQNNWHLY